VNGAAYAVGNKALNTVQQQTQQQQEQLQRIYHVSQLRADADDEVRCFSRQPVFVLFLRRFVRVSHASNEPETAVKRFTHCFSVLCLVSHVPPF